MFKDGNFKEAIEKFSECLELDPNNETYNSQILFNRAQAYSRISMNKEALDDLTKALEMNPEYLKAQAKRAEIHLGL